MIPMKLLKRGILVCGVALFLALPALPQQRRASAVAVAGTYDNLSVGQDSGDLEGMRIILIDGGGGIYAIVQEAAGGVELPAPALSEVTVKGTNISFTIKSPEAESQTFSGKVSASGLKLRRGSSETFFLKRRKC
jgi:hypothetical protein